MPKNQTVYALVAIDYEFNDDVHVPTDGHLVRKIFLNKRDALEALDALTLEQSESLRLSQLCYDIDDLLRNTGQNAAEFCESLNHVFKTSQFSEDNLLDQLEEAMTVFDAKKKLKLLSMLGIEFCKVVETAFVG